MKQLILQVARATGLFRLSAWLTRKQLRVLCYHGIWSGPGHFGNYLFMSEARFGERMAFLSRWGARVLPLAQALEQLDGGTLAPRSVVITIDDGWRSTLTGMVPSLAAHGYPATLYVTSYYASTQRPVFNVALAYALERASADSFTISLGDGAETVLQAGDALQREAARQAISDYASSLPDDLSRQALLQDVVQRLGLENDPAWQAGSFLLADRESLRQLSGSGVDLQLHTHRHRTRVEGVSCLADEIRDNRQWLDGIATGPLAHFCYPSGEYQEADFAELQALGVRSATTTEIGLCTRESNFLALPRILDGEAISQLEFEAELCGFLSLVRRALG